MKANMKIIPVLLAFMALPIGAMAEVAPWKHAVNTVKLALQHVEEAIQAGDWEAGAQDRCLNVRYYGADDEKPVSWAYDAKQQKRIAAAEFGAVYIISFSLTEKVKTKGGAFHFICSAEDGHIIGVMGEK